MDFLAIPLPEIIAKKEVEGDFRGAKITIRKFLKMDIPQEMKSRLLYETERIGRLKKDFPYSREDALKILRKEVKNFEDEELDRWMREGVVDYINYNGKTLFFGRFLDNIAFLKPSVAKRRKKNEEREKIKELLRRRIDAILKGERGKYRISAGIKVRIKKKIPDADKYRVWLPIPKSTRGVDKIKLLFAYPDTYEISPEDYPQRTLYFESSSREYRVEFEYEIGERNGYYEGECEEGYIQEKLPHVRFTPYLRALAREIVEDADTPEDRARKIYEWITRNIRYTYVREYGTYENISEYVATNLRGDCGFHALLFITLCRIAGIPAKWQSGWFLTPYYSGPHDWSEIYVNDGWIPVDLSFGNIRRRRGKYHDFYFGNLDAFRMIANDDFQVELNPKKKYYRSDPVDNQRGEVEWSGGNIYYDKFSWKIYAREIKKIS